VNDLTTVLAGAEAEMLRMPQAECPVVHRFGPGVYIREVCLPAGAIAIGHKQRYEHTNILLKGAVAIVNDDRTVSVLRAPLFFVGKPGRKVGYVLEDTVWQNVYATDERDIETLEAMFLEKSDASQSSAAERMAIAHASHAADRADFARVIAAAGFDARTVREQSENLADQMPMPDAFASAISVRPSPIEGRGVFSSFPRAAGDVIGPARIDGYRTPIGRYANHATTPNARFQVDVRGDVWAVAVRDIAGCVGGDAGEEITVDYRQVLALSGIHVQGAIAA
jgi:hypothetical protein